MRASTCGCSTSRSSAGAPSTPSSIRSAASSVPRDGPRSEPSCDGSSTAACAGRPARSVVPSGTTRARRCRPTRTPAWRCTSLGRCAHELRRAFETPLPDTTFVFGHTHKPFVGTRGVAGYARPIAVVNTGGWVVDHPEAEPLKGASVVLVDDEANVVSLQLYRQRSDGAADPPAVVPADARLDRLRRAGPQRHRCDPRSVGPVHHRRGGDPRRSAPRAATPRGCRPPTAPSRRNEAGLRT